MTSTSETASNVATSGQVCTSNSINQLCRDIIVVSQHQLNVPAQGNVATSELIYNTTSLCRDIITTMTFH